MQLHIAHCRVQVFSPQPALSSYWSSRPGSSPTSQIRYSIILCDDIYGDINAIVLFQNIYHDHPILYVLLFGLVGAKITNRLVVAHMCKGEITHRDACMLAPLLLILNQYFNTLIPEIILLYVSLVMTFGNDIRL